jgi:hypothetical protein
MEINVSPWGTVYLDGRRVGNTPLLRELRATRGPHRIKVVHPKAGTQEREVMFGEQPRASFVFDRPQEAPTPRSDRLASLT